MSRIGLSELVVIFLIVLILFGTKRLPEIGEAIGRAIKEFKKASSGDSHSESKAQDHEKKS